ncbi:hypothetical protein ACFLWS_05915 [Chloroflexota bacterium]
MTVKSSPLTLVGELTAIFCRQCRYQENMSFLAEDINRSDLKLYKNFFEPAMKLISK